MSRGSVLHFSPMSDVVAPGTFTLEVPLHPQPSSRFHHDLQKPHSGSLSATFYCKPPFLQGIFWNNIEKGWWSLLSHSSKTCVCSFLPKLQTHVPSHDHRLAHLVFSVPGGCRHRLRVCLNCLNLLVPHWHCGKSFCELVHVRTRRFLLAA